MDCIREIRFKSVEDIMDVRPFLFVIGLPLVILLIIPGCWIAKARIEKWKVALFT